MKFTLQNGVLQTAMPDKYIGTPAKDGSWMDFFNNFSEAVLQGEMELIIKPLGHFLRDFGQFLWEWFIFILPDLMGYGAVFYGVLIILGAMTSKGQMMKHLGRYGAYLIASTCILGSV